MHWGCCTTPQNPARLLRNSISSQQNYALQRCDFNTLATPGIAASQNIIYAHHIVPGGFESGAVFFVGARRQRGFFRAADPANLVFRCLFAGWTVDRMRPGFGFLIKKISFVHLYSPLAAIPGFVILIGSSISFSRFGGMTFLATAISRTVFPVLYDSLAIAVAAS